MARQLQQTQPPTCESSRPAVHEHHKHRRSSRQASKLPCRDQHAFVLVCPVPLRVACRNPLHGFIPSRLHASVPTAVLACPCCCCCLQPGWDGRSAAAHANGAGRDGRGRQHQVQWGSTQQAAVAGHGQSLWLDRRYVQGGVLRTQNPNDPHPQTCLTAFKTRTACQLPTLLVPHLSYDPLPRPRLPDRTAVRLLLPVVLCRSGHQKGAAGRLCQHLHLVKPPVTAPPTAAAAATLLAAVILTRPWETVWLASMCAGLCFVLGNPRANKTVEVATPQSPVLLWQAVCAWHAVLACCCFETYVTLNHRDLWTVHKHECVPAPSWLGLAWRHRQVVAGCCPQPTCVPAWGITSVRGRCPKFAHA